MFRSERRLFLMAAPCRACADSARRPLDRRTLREIFLMSRPSLLTRHSCTGAIFNKANSPPRITARRGGRAIKKILRSIRFLRGQGGVPIERTRNTTPAASIRRLRAIFLGDAATPPRGDARRGIRFFQNDSKPQLSRGFPSQQRFWR